MEPGVYDNLPIEEYHNSDGISKTGLAVFDDLPLKYWEKYLNPSREEAAKTEAQLIGTLAHCALFEPEKFEQLYCKGPCDDMRKSEWKAALESLPAGVTLIKPKHYEQAWALAGEAGLNEGVAKLIAKGSAEVSMYWRPAGYVGMLKARPDWISDDGVLVDLKTVVSAHAGKVSKAISEYRLHWQAAMALDGYKACFGGPAKEFVFVCAEKEAPHAEKIKLYKLGADDLNLARAQYMDAFGRYCECRLANEWPGYSSEIEEIHLPEWEYRSWENAE